MSGTPPAAGRIPSDGARRLQHFVRSRLTELQMTPAELARRGGPNRTTLHKAITGTATLRGSTLARLDLALGWVPGSAAATLDGGAPTTRSLDGPDGQTAAALDSVHAMVQRAAALLLNAQSLLTELTGAPTDGTV